MDIKGELISIVMKAAPSLAGALAGPAGALISTILSNAFNVGSDDPKAITTAIQSDPDHDIKLKALELQHEQVLKNMEVKHHELDTQDRANARLFNLQSHDWVLPIIAVGYSGLFAGLLLLDALKIFPINGGAMQDLYSIAMIIVNFYLGSSHGERRAQQRITN